MSIRLASVLCLGAALAFGAFACGGSQGPAQDAGPDVPTITEGCAFDYVPELDTDSRSLTFDFSGLDLAVNNDGFDLDGQTTTAASDANGCYQPDVQPTGAPVRSVDARLSMGVEAARAAGLDLSSIFGGATETATLPFRLRLGRWNGTLDDCVTLELQANTGAGYATVSSTWAWFTNGRTPTFAVGAPIRLDVPIAITDPAICTPGTYGAASVPAAPACSNAAFSCTTTLPLAIVGAKMRLYMTLDPAAPGGARLITSAPGMPVTGPSMLGGYLVIWDTSAGRPGCTDAPLSDTNLEAALQKAACDLGVGAKWASDVCPAFADNLDLHDSAGTLSACAAGGSATTSNANAISFAAYLGN